MILRRFIEWSAVGGVLGIGGADVTEAGAAAVRFTRVGSEIDGCSAIANSPLKDFAPTLR